MPIMIGFAEHRRRLLAAEAERYTAEAAPYGALRIWAVGAFARGSVGVETELELVMIQDTDDPFQRRPDFWVSHMRPRVGTRFYVYTPDEAEEFEDACPVLIEAMTTGVQLV
ncbi:MAG: hypothetical protein U0821_26615 [Chloroflexota bacterium]